ncbi:formylmethanofuran--tetrahydromethanopterin N-formyltransferase [bacterium]|nr:formylmethanofuran--tetrahydromethanopterin N-formyltransferase [bacterium]
MKIDQTVIEDTYAEGFGMRYARLIVTAASQRWLKAAVQEFSGYGCSVIQCDAEVGLEGYLKPEQTFDGREGAAVLAFGFSTEKLAEAVAKRAGQCLMTCATSAVFDGYTAATYAAEIDKQEKLVSSDATSVPAPRKPQQRIPLGNHLRFFGDGFQQSKLLGDRRFWRIPVMDGEFICEESLGVSKGVAGGNFLIQSKDQMTGLTAAERAVDAIAELPGVITPFPGGVVRSGSKVGSKYKSLIASTSHQFCPTLRGRVDSLIHPDANCVYEIVIDGIDFAHVANAINCGIRASIGEGIVAISAGNYGGKLGKHHFPLHKVLKDAETMEAN